LLQKFAQFFALFIEPNFAFQFLHPAVQLFLGRVRRRWRPARRLVLQCPKQGLKSPLFPLVIRLA
jgi:hypothetical protein